MFKKKITVKSGYHPRKSCPIYLYLKEKIDKARLIDEEDQEIACQIEECKEGCLLGWIVRDMPSQEKRTYTLIIGEENLYPEKRGVKLTQTENKIEINISGSPFSNYHYGDVVRPYLWPMLDKEGRSLTRAPAKPGNPEGFDHIHHRSCWVAHGDVNGVDNWSEEKGHGYQIHRQFKEIVSGPVFGKIKAKNYWTDAKEKKVLEEERTMRIYNLSSCRIIDFEIDFRATEGNVKFGDTKEGGILSLRVNPLITVEKGGLIENAYGGVNEEETWGKRACWCDYSGKIAGERVGLAIFDHPSNFRYPTYWHVRNYGLMTANPFALSYYYSYTLLANKGLVFRYRLLVHPGNAAEGRVKEAYHNYINPPEIKID